MASIQTPQGKLYYKPVNLYLGIKQIDRDVAYKNLVILLNVMEQNKILVSPAYGTLLGIVRENNFIEWDEDIDLFVLEEDKQKLLNVFWELKKVGFELVRVDRGGLLYSVMRHGEYIDFYIMQKLTPEIRYSGGGFMLDRHLTEVTDWTFRDVNVKIPKDYNECLTLLYGDWKTPVKYADFHLSKQKVFMIKIINKIKMSLPAKISLWLVKKYHRKDFVKFMHRCKKCGIVFKYPVYY